MTELLQAYKCQVSENIVEVIHEGKGKLVCCGKPMELKVENTVDASKEKHVPVVERITFYRQWLQPGELPESTFEIEADQITAREYCNLHGLWKA